MKAVIKSAAEKGVTYVPDYPLPQYGEDEVLFQVKATAICGTDVSIWKWNDAGKNFAEKFGAQLPFVLGHECCGIVVAKGNKVSDAVQIGDKIALETHIYCGECYQCTHGDAHNCQKLKIYGVSCNGCFGEYATAPEKLVFKLPDEITYEQGALFEPAGVAMFAYQESGMKPGDTVLIYGCGPIGQMAIQLAFAKGAGQVIAVDIQESRVELAKSLGAIGINSAKEDLVSTVKKYTAEKGGVDIIIEVSGASSIYSTMADCLKKEGHIMLLAHPGCEVSFDVMKTMHHSGATIKGIFGRRIWESWTELTELVASGKVDLAKVITHRFSFADADKAFEQIMEGSGKVIFLPEL